MSYSDDNDFRFEHFEDHCVSKNLENRAPIRMITL